MYINIFIYMTIISGIYFYIPEARLKLLGGWKSARRMEGMRNVLKVSELNHSVKETAYQENLRVKYEVYRGGEVESVEKAWEKF